MMTHGVIDRLPKTNRDGSAAAEVRFLLFQFSLSHE